MQVKLLISATEMSTKQQLSGKYKTLLYENPF